MDREIVEKLGNIRLLILDFDGVMTDNRVIISEDGKESVVCDRSDGMGISLLKRNKNIEVIVLSTEKNKVVEERCKKLAIESYQGVVNKIQLLVRLLEKRQICCEHIAYLGNDVNDLECLRKAGLGVVVADAHEDVKSSADLILSKCGGRGAVRELCDMIIYCKEKLK